MGIVCFFQADAKVGLAGERAGETVIESKQRIISRSMFSADFQAVCQILIITFSKTPLPSVWKKAQTIPIIF